ncbi:MAG: sulfatase-like hydrolase/transferase [Deltaproteobacteria bacterium]|nr:sulfatase-like hydrolase/transferase [Deltaproteobacteria bacterium]
MPAVPVLVAWIAACSTNAPTPGATHPLPHPERPDVLLVTLDTTRADVLGAYGSPLGATPTVDRLASEGIRFERAFTVTPLTIPAHSSIFTGLLPPRHQVRDNGDFYLSDQAVTLAELLREAGWITMASVGAEVTSHHWGFAQGFDAFFDEMGPPDEKEQQNRWRIERRGDAVVADALAWYAARTGDPTPTFAWVHLFDPHFPYEAPEPFASRFAGRPYAAEVAWTDQQLGVLLQALEGRLDRTWIVIMGDHGEGLGAHGEALHGVLLYNATTHVPLVIRPPGGLPEARSVEDPVSLVDVLPTVLSLAGVPIPAGLDGHDLVPAMEGVPGALPEDRQVYVESLYAWRHYGWAPQKAIVDRTRKYIGSTTPEIYAASDVMERTNLASEDPARLAEDRARLDALLASLEPSAGAAVPVTESPERLAQLEALGYVTGVSDQAAQPPGEGLPDPVQRLPLLKNLEQARQAVQRGDFADARRLVEDLIVREPGLFDARMMLATLQVRAGEVEGALETLGALDALQSSSQARAMRGTILLQIGRHAEAAEWLASALEMDPYLVRAWETYLHALFLSGDFGRLETEVARARSLLPDAQAPKSMEGILAAAQGDYEEAERILLPALAADAQQPFCNYGMGVVRRAQGRTDEAETFLLEEVRLFRALPARKMLVEIYAETHRFQEQLEQLEALRAVEPPNVPTLHSWAQALFNLGRYREADTAVDACIQADPRYPACAMLKANTLARTGRPKEAQEAYQRALEIGRTQLAVVGARPPEAPAPTEPPPTEP